MKYFKVFTVVVLTIFAFSVAAANAQKETAAKIAYVDIGQLFDSYAKTKEHNKVLEDKFSAFEAEHNKRLEKIKEQGGKLAALKEAERNKLQEQLSKDEAALGEFDRQQQLDLRREYNDRMKEILLEIEKVIKDFAKKEGYTLILNNKILAYGDESLDITDKIIKLLNPEASAKK